MRVMAAQVMVSVISRVCFHTVASPRPWPNQLATRSTIRGLDILRNI